MNNNDNESTRERIVQSARHNFYHNGYKKTTISNIFEDIDIPSGVFTYYFKRKDVLVKEIYREFFDSIDALILDIFPNMKTMHFLKQTVLSKIYYDIILSDEKNARFYYEVIEKDSNYRVNKTITDPIFKTYIDEFQLILTEEQFQIICLFNAGARREFTMNYFKNKLNISPYEVSNYFESIVPLLMRIDKGYVDSVLLQSANIAKSIDISSLVFLV